MSSSMGNITFLLVTGIRTWNDPNVWRHRDIDDAVGGLALDGMAVGGAEQVAGIDRLGQRQHLAGRGSTQVDHSGRSSRVPGNGTGALLGRKSNA